MPPSSVKPGQITEAEIPRPRYSARSGLREGDEAGFGRRINAAKGRPIFAGRRRHIHHVSPPCHEHVRYDEPSEQERRREIDADRLFDPLGGQFFVMGKSLDPRVVDEDVDCSPLADCRLDESCEIVALSDVSGDSQHFDTRRAKPPRPPLRAFPDDGRR